MKVLYPASHLISDLDDAKICVKIARHSVCATCKSCVGMHPSLGVTVTLDDEDVDHMLASAIDSDDDTTPEYLDACACGHGVGAHGVDQARALGPVEFRRRAMVAIRLDEELQNSGKLLDFAWLDEDIISLRKQMSLPSLPMKGGREKAPLSPSSSLSDLPNGPPTKRRRISLSSSSITADDHRERQASFSDDDDEQPLALRPLPRPMNGHAPAKTSNTTRTNAKGKHMQAQTGPVTLPPPTDAQRADMKRPATNGNDVVVKVEDTMDEGQLDKLATGVTVDTTTGASSPFDKPEKPSAAELRKGVIKIMPVENDGEPASMILLTNLKTLFQKQLPVMPREYITRLVFDPQQRCVAIVKNGLKVVGGICFRPFPHRGFAEIVFFATHSVDQVKGYGGMLMDHFKMHIKRTWPNMLHFLTYADNYAVGYFRKQGFSKDITLDRAVWAGYIKDYEGGTIMQCTMVDKVDYLNTRDILLRQREFILERIKEKSRSHIVYPAPPQFLVPDEQFVPLRAEDVPGLRESGWTPDANAPRIRRPPPNPEHATMEKLLKDMQGHHQSWPFLSPVSVDDVPDYYETIKHPMDMRTMEDKLAAHRYPNMEAFITDAQLMWDNCMSFNPADTVYHKCAKAMAKWFKTRIANRVKKEEPT